MSASVVIALYKVPEANQPEFLQIVGDKRKYFLEVGYATNRIPILMRSRKDPTVLIEVFEWSSQEAINKAHDDEGVWKYWKRMEELWEKGGFNFDELAEAQMPFPNFEPVNGVY